MKTRSMGEKMELSFLSVRGSKRKQTRFLRTPFKFFRLMAIAGLCFLSISVLSADLTVTSNLDTGDDATINTDLAADQADGAGLSIREAINWASNYDTIYFAPSVTSITLGGTELTLNKPLTIVGNGNVTISGNNASRILYINYSPWIGGDTTTRLGGLTLTGGNGVGAEPNGDGGAIYLHRNHLVVTNCTIQNSTATGNGGGICAPEGVSTSSLTITDSTINGNSAAKYGGGIFSNNTCTMTRVTISGNSVTGTSEWSSGGAGFASGYSTNYSNTFTDCQIINNNSASEGGGFCSDRKPTTMISCSISGNTSAKNGAGIRLACGGVNTFIDCTIANNTISSGNDARYGAGIELANTGDGTGATLHRCTISGNQNLSTGGDGGGVSIGYNWGSNIVVDILDCTISGNTTNDNGAGIRCRNSGYLAIRNTTITNNSGNQGDGIWLDAGTTDMLNTIIYGNGDEDLRGNYRIIQNCLYGTTGGFSVTTSINNITGQDPLLGALADNGGETLTHLPAANSPVINAGTATAIVTLDDVYGQLVDCGNISGIVVGTNTDAQGFMYASVVDAEGGAYRVDLFKDSDRTQRVALSDAYTQYAGEQTVALNPDNSSGIGGSIKVDSTSPTVSNLRIYDGLYDQRGEGYPRKEGSALDIGSVEIVTAKKWDFDGDKFSDVLASDSSNNNGVIFLMNGTTPKNSGTVYTMTDTNWQLLGLKDFNGDGKADMIWQHAVNKKAVIYIMNGLTITTAKTIYNGTSGWVIDRLADFNGDGKCDILWKHPTSGGAVIWLMNGTNTVAVSSLANSIYLSWLTLGTGDFNGDGKADILWEKTSGSPRKGVIYLMNGTSIAGSGVVYSKSDINWTVTNLLDYNADGKCDMLWKNTATNSGAIYIMNGTTITGSGIIYSNSTVWQVVQSGDFNADNKNDLFWIKPATGETYIWLMNGTAMQNSGSPFTYSGNWVVKQLLDFNNDGKADVLMQNNDTNQAVDYLIDGKTLLNSGTLFGAGTKSVVVPLIP